jgi:hypothetical protein
VLIVTIPFGIASFCRAAFAVAGVAYIVTSSASRSASPRSSWRSSGCSPG